MKKRPIIRTPRESLLYSSSAGAALQRERNELQRLIVSRFPIIYFDTREESRAERLIISAVRATNRRVWRWSLSTGLVLANDKRTDPATANLEDALRRIAEQPGDDVFIMPDADKLVETDTVVQRLLHDIAQHGSGTTLVLVGPRGDVPATLAGKTAVVELEPPDATLIASHINHVLINARRVHGSHSELSAEGFNRLAQALKGLTLEEIDQVLLHLIHDDGRIDDSEIDKAIEQKARILARSGVLALETPDTGLEWVAGLSHVKTWVKSRVRAFTPDAEAYGITPPRGIVLTGVPGCGKSFIAKAIAYEWGMPLLRLDGGALYDSFVGASERNLREALSTANALAPCVLWVDEIEKSFGSTGPAQADGGLSYRLLGTLATWMQERPAPVFLVATSNDVLKLPSELLRQGRFDEIFFVDLPDAAAREHLYRLQLSRAQRDFSHFDCQRLAALTEGFSGAEIEQSVTNGLYTAFALGREVTTDDLAHEIARTRPLSQVDPLRIEQIRQWGTMHARPA